MDRYLSLSTTAPTTNNVSDSQVLGDLLNQIPSDELIDSVYTDGAYDTKLCRQVISDRHAHAVIPPRKNARPWKDKKLGSLERNELLKTVKRLGRTLWKALSLKFLCNKAIHKSIFYFALLMLLVSPTHHEVYYIHPTPPPSSH